MMIFFYIVCMCIVLYFLSVFYINSSIRTIFYPKYKTQEEIIDISLERKDFTKDFLSIPKDEFVVKSKFGYNLFGFCINSDVKTDKTIIFCHGITWNRYAMVKYLNYFKKNNWNAVFFDNRSHGLSGGGIPTYGYYEKYDLKSIENFTLKKYPQTKNLGVFGESLGGATVLQFLPLTTKVNFAIADCSYSDFTKELQYQVELKRLPKILKKYLMFKMKEYFSHSSDIILEKISPEEAILKSDIPILFVHGLADKYVPAKFSIEMYESRKDKFKTDLLLIKHAKHAYSIRVDRKKYEEKLDEFITQLNI